ncbi:glycerol-3-phosphate dehydrogenase [Pseudomonas sp. MS19]|uniref:glycerol-3-phosphate dehydrogenase n=1 Tax=Pseudomonas sp. MS19 TaxID=2579939 RepID=UPI001562BF54|nr:glycerol-3-phosphate dehydrogenase [Pseudomonas sp. MS19]NRH26526.1 glycerol-3-phosphate dehydrogenase [Pseudomonas sp. MS19]
MLPHSQPHPPFAEVYDLAVIGGGINGAGIAADAAGRGLSVFLCEKDDLGEHTSSASSKLIHGGLRYLEHYEFRLVREALAEREVLLAKAPHIIKPMRFILPHRPHLRPAWMIRAGLFLYDHLGKREKLAGSKGLRFDSQSPLKNTIKRGFEYSDCWVDDARLVVLNAMDAHDHGAHVHTQTRCISARRTRGVWHIHLERKDGTLFAIRAHALVNAAGPWVASVLSEELKQQSPYGIRLIKGSHIIVERQFEGDQAYILQNEDRRIVFAIPYLGAFTMIGTTDEEYHGDANHVSISSSETQYLLDVVNNHFKRQLSPEDILHSFSGVRPLCDDESDDPSAVTRDYTLSISGNPGEAPLLSVFGGKLTTYRRLAESALELLAPFFPKAGPEWTAKHPLPGAENINDANALGEQLHREHEWLPIAVAQRWAHSYGSRSYSLLSNTQNIRDLGQHFGAGLYQREVDYLCEHEWAITAPDILWRRSKLQLFMSPQEQAQLSAYLEAKLAVAAESALIS